MFIRSIPFIMFLFIVTATTSRAQQVADTSFKANVGSAAYKPGAGPVVLIDEAHHNFHTMSGRYLAFARLLQKDGYDVRPLREKFTPAHLAQAKILVISNALAPENETEWSLPTPPAFDSAEIAVVREWVREGGSLFLIADHMPFPGAAETLAREFGVHMANGFALDAHAENGRMLFTRTAGTLSDHPVTRGRNAAERVDSIVSFTGQAFRLTRGESLMTLDERAVLFLPQVAWQFSRLTPSMSASGMHQGALISFGKGRVAVFGEAAMFSAQLGGPNRTPAGMNDPSAPHNAQFLINIMHWLSGLI